MTAYIGHARSDYDGKPGDSSGKEVAVTKFTESTSKTSVYNWTWVYRAKRNRTKIASMCEKACKNNAIGYCSNAKSEYGKTKSLDYLAGKTKYDLSKITTKTGCSCGDLFCLCSHYAGLSSFYVGSALSLKKKLDANKNFTRYKYRKGMTLKRGDCLITAHESGKNNHVVVYLGATYSGKFPSLPKRGYFIKGDEGVNVQRLQAFLNWAVGADLSKDGEVGPLTLDAVEDYQEKYGLVKDRQFGRKCLNKAKEILK